MFKILAVVALSSIIGGCSSIDESQALSAKNTDNAIAEVTKVEAMGKPNDYSFAVTVSSPDTGCDRYADWWEVITPEGELIYRRVLLHSHVDEQPFQRTGGRVAIQPEQEVIVRVHMYPDGYSTSAQQGTVRSGFSTIDLPLGFAADLESVEPLPTNCAF